MYTAHLHCNFQADWGGGMSASCKPRVQLFVTAGMAA